jgi:hypothetical protein
MQIRPINYLHFAHHFCAGYNKYLENRKEGGIIKFNWHFFFFNILWLSYHRMHAHVGSFIFTGWTIFFFFNSGYISSNTAKTLFMIYFFIYVLFSYHFYETHTQNKLILDGTDPYKKIRPYNFPIYITVFIITSYAFTMATVYLLKHLK